jgi:2-dehydropantoate 2-reductase
MKIAVAGCGAVGSYYGALLARGGHETHFLLRSDYEVVRRRGVRVFSYRGDFEARPHCASRPEEIGVCDLVVIGLKSTANGQFASLLTPLVGPATMVLTLQNGLGNEEALARLFPAEQILGGMCFVCLNRTAPGEIRHMDHGQIVMGEFFGEPRERTRQLAEVLKQAGIQCKLTNNLARTHWEKLIWNIPFNGLGVAGAAGLEAFEGELPPRLSRKSVARSGVLTTDLLLANARWSRILLELMLEVIAAARKQGFEVPDSLAAENIDRTRTMGPYKASTLIDFERGLPLELESLFLEPLRQARKAGVSVLRLERLCDVLQRIA